MIRRFPSCVTSIWTASGSSFLPRLVASTTTSLPVASTARMPPLMFFTSTVPPAGTRPCQWNGSPSVHGWLFHQCFFSLGSAAPALPGTLPATSPITSSRLTILCAQPNVVRIVASSVLVVRIGIRALVVVVFILLGLALLLRFLLLLQLALELPLLHLHLALERFLLLLVSLRVFLVLVALRACLALGVRLGDLLGNRFGPVEADAAVERLELEPRAAVTDREGEIVLALLFVGPLDRKR